jgi:carbonic anhydrase
MVTLDTEQPPQLEGGPLNGVYEFAQFHFHWGDNDTLGSENLLGSKSFAMELHVVMYKKIYRNARAAIEHSDGLAVLAFFFEVSSQPNPIYGEFTALLQNITQPLASTKFKKSPALMDLLSTDLMRYYTYK